MTLPSVRTLPLVLMCAHCLPWEDPGPVSLEEVVAGYVISTGLDYADCGAVEEVWASCTDDTELVDGYACLAAAFETCTPSRLDVRHATIDAGPLPETLLVEPSGGGCAVVSFQDHGDDPYKGDYGDILHHSCAELVPVDCGYAATSDCVLIEEWYQ
jgi:hypothetical protein